MLRKLFTAALITSLSACGGSGGWTGGEFLTADPQGLSSGGGDFAAAPGAEAVGVADELVDAIEEADLYRLDGDLLYVLNAYRGFTVVDLSVPALAGQLALKAIPREMFLLGDRAFVLLSGFGGGTRLVEVSVADPAALEIVASFSLSGAYRTSRLMGGVLVVLTDGAAHSFAIEPELAPADSLAISGGIEFAHATDALFFVAASDALGGTRLTTIDVSDQAGELELRGSATVPGYVADEFKLHFGAGMLRVVTHDWVDGGLSRLFVVDVSDPDAPFVRSTLEIVKGEQLFATRFTDETAYIVTFEQVDPLWIVDLSDPDAPAIAAELVVPGWSTHLVPLPGVLVALGMDPADGWHAIVSLFDVSDPAAPFLASRVDFGWGWSSAFSDVKAFGVFADEGLVLVPFASEANRLAVVSLGTASLALEGWIDADGEVLRGFPHASGICALSTEEVVVADPATLAILGQVTIAEDVADAARLPGGTLIEAVRHSGGCRVGGVELPLSFSAMYPFEELVAVTGSDDDGAAAFVVDFGESPPSVSSRIELPGAGDSGSTEPGWGALDPAGTGWNGSAPGAGILTAGGRLLVRGAPLGAPDLALGSGAVLDGFTVLSLAGAEVESAIAVRGALVTGAVAEGEDLVLTYGTSAGVDADGRPLLFHELVRIELPVLEASPGVNVPGFLVSASGALVHTLEQTWGDEWSFGSSVVASSVSSGSAEVLDRLDLPAGAYDFRAAGETLYFTAYGNAFATPMLGMDGIAAAPSGEIGTVRLESSLAFGPELVYADHFASLLLPEAASALVVVDGVAVDRWELAGPAAELSFTAEVGTWPASARPDGSSESYLLGLGFGGTLVVP